MLLNFQIKLIISDVFRAFRIIDDDGNRSLDMSEFKKGCKDYGLDLSVSDVQSVFNSIDLNGSGSIDFEEFLRAVRVSIVTLT